jgi:hypothetical protein
MVETTAQWWLAERPMSRKRLVEHLSTLLWEGFFALGAKAINERGNQ